MPKEFILSSGEVVLLRDKNTSKKYATGKKYACGSYGEGVILGQTVNSSGSVSSYKFVVKLFTGEIKAVSRSIFTSKSEYKTKRTHKPKFISMTDLKNCKVCLLDKPLTEFNTCGGVNSVGIPNTRGVCKPCHSLQTCNDAEEYLSKKEYIEELHILHQEGKRRCRYCEEVKDYAEFPLDNVGRVHYGYKSYCKQCSWDMWSVPYTQRSEYAEQKAEWDKTYNKKHREALNNKQVLRYHSDEQFKIMVTIRNETRRAILRAKKGGSAKFIPLVQCTVTELKKHIEKRFLEGMTWGNYGRGGWTIDHIIPLSIFNLEDSAEKRKATQYKNLRPLWEKANMKKGKNVLKELINLYRLHEFCPIAQEK